MPFRSLINKLVTISTITLFLVIFTVVISFSKDIVSDIKNPKIDTGTFGIGLILGGPTGISFELGRLSHTLKAGIGWTLLSSVKILDVNVDYTYVMPGLITKVPELGPYIGLGVKLLFLNDEYKKDKEWDTGSSIAIGARIPVGIKYIIKKVPIDIFLEAVPTLIIIPKVELGIDGAFGARYYF